MAIRGSHLVALAILAGIGGWMLTGELIRGGQADPNAKSIAEREEARSSKAFRVRVVEIQPQERPSQLIIRGRTKASATITVRAETGGTVQQTDFHKGKLVKKGEVLCIIDKGIRSSNMAQAEATLAQAKADYEANKKLVKRGFATKSKLRSLRAALDAAKAAVATASQDIGRTTIIATADGQLQEPYAETGDNLAPGGICATLMQTQPMLFSGQVPEREVGAVKDGMAARVTMISGEEVEGIIRYISPVADAKTRTFEIEVVLSNDDRSLRDGMTSTATIDLPVIEAYRLDPNWITLADDGQVGVRAVNAGKEVEFHPVKILVQDDTSIWASGLKAGLMVITLGQNYVIEGEIVVPVPDSTSGENKAETGASS